MNRRPRVLAVDDDPMNRIVMMEHLEEDYDLLVVASGEECMASIAGFRPDVVLLDIMMPGIDGYGTCRRIKADPALRHTKVILVSAKAHLEERLDGYDAGADDYVTKPFSGDELRAKLDVYLQLRSIEELDDLKGQFLGLLAHETRTPLTAILSPARLLQLELSDQPEQLEMVDLIVRGATRLEAMIERALRLCEYKSGRAILQLDGLDLGEALTTAMTSHADRIAQKQLRVHQEAQAGLEVEADPSEIERALSAMLVRAIDASPKGGTIEIGWRACTDWVEVQVRDEGPALDESWLPHLFEDFYVPSLANHTGDLELDLALAGSIVREHGGRVWAEVDGNGANVFTLRLGRRAVPRSTTVRPRNVRCPLEV
jgi:two-component system, sensor histidine kinase and response regulator